MKKLLVKCLSVKALTPSIMALWLEVPAQYTMIPGQYIPIWLNGEQAYFSVANSLKTNDHIELHVRVRVEQSFPMALIKSSEITIGEAVGQCHIDRLDLLRSVVLFSCGTGFAQTKAMVEGLIEKEFLPKVTIIRLAKSPEDIYLKSLELQWAERLNDFDAQECFNDMPDESMILDSLFTTNIVNSDQQMVISGSFQMADRFRQAFFKWGVSRNHIHSDAFEFI